MSTHKHPSAFKQQSVEMLEKADVTSPEISGVQIANSRSQWVCRQFDLKVLPIVCCLYVLSYLDRGNIGNAKTAGMQKDLHLSSSQWTWVLNSFYVCYVCFEWTNMLWKIWPAHIYVAVLCILWGTAAMSSGTVHNLGGLIVSRCFLGVFEAAFGAGAPYFLSLFYNRKELGFRIALLLGMSPLANCFASALAYGIVQIKGSLLPWRYLFFIEGAPTIAFSVVVFFFLADGPSEAKFFDEEDQTLALERLETNYVHTAIHFCCNFSFAGLSNFLPTIVANMGYTNVNAQGVTAPIYFGAFLCCVGTAFLSDRIKKRGILVAIFSAIGGIGYLILVTKDDKASNAARYAGVWLAACGVFPALSLNMTWLLNNQQGDSKRGVGLAILAIFGQCSSFVSSSLFPNSAAPYYKKGCAVGCALTFLITAIALVHTVVLHTENKRRDRKYGPADETLRLDVTETGDKNPHFRYLL
ncbi:MFS general substrate transporter [Myriangium duriaei CBS 260.36]|uniref:MFS general substrate transporter n=1 Tax=Myriangium duriaei CBS 260.36 TaxID=1168546 RepID=A0A9P4J898_9PEZI|nr:MFS general substrate transporter [Myriangium duriaei CBS 260.36]